MSPVRHASSSIVQPAAAPGATRGAVEGQRWPPCYGARVRRLSMSSALPMRTQRAATRHPSVRTAQERQLQSQRAPAEEADPGEIKYQLKRIWREVRDSLKRAGANDSASRAIWLKVSEEARRAADAGLRSATPQRRPFPKHSPEKPSRPARRTRPRAGQGGRRRS